MDTDGCTKYEDRLYELNAQNSTSSPKYEEIMHAVESGAFLYQNCGSFHKSRIYRQTRTQVSTSAVYHIAELQQVLNKGTADCSHKTQKTTSWKIKTAS